MKIKTFVLLLVCAVFAFPLHAAARNRSKEPLSPASYVEGSTLADNIYIKDVFTATGLPDVMVLWLGDRENESVKYPPRYTLNGGNTWQAADAYNLSHLLVGIVPRLDPQNPMRLFSFLHENTYLQTLHRSGDWGATWSLAVGNDDIQVNNFFTSPKDPQAVYASWVKRCTPSPYQCENELGGIYQSTDGGVNWTPWVQKEWSAFFMVVPSPVTVGDGYYMILPTTGSPSYWLRFGSSEKLPFPAWEIALDAVSAERLYGVSYNFDAGYTSSDGGHTWDTWDSLPPGKCSQLMAHPTQANTLYLRCDGGIYRSVNGGEQWSSITSLPGDALKANLAKPGQLLWSHSGCLWASDDQGTTWNGVSCIFVTASKVFLPLVR